MSLNTLRSITSRLTLTPTDQLPRHAGYLATSIVSCRDELSNPQSKTENSVLIHKLRTRVSALLQDRTPEGRLAGVIIAKALIENGGNPILTESGSWVRSLISCINRNDGPGARKLYIIAIVRTYILTTESQALVREIATPTLSAFISATLNAIKPQAAVKCGNSGQPVSLLMTTVLQSWYRLLEHFPSTFRPSSGAIRSVCLSLLSDSTCSEDVRSHALSVLSRLHECAPKNASVVERLQAVVQTIDAAHDTADLVFRAVLEDWSPLTTRTSTLTKKQHAASEPFTSTKDAAGLEPWTGLASGCTVLVTQIEIVKYLISDQTSQDMSLPIAALLDLTGRLTAVTVPTTKFFLKPNPEITKEERDELWVNLPRVHCAVLRLLSNLVNCVGATAVQLSRVLLTQWCRVFEAEKDSLLLRSATYRLLTVLLPAHLVDIDKTHTAIWKALIHHCCADLVCDDRDGSKDGIQIHGSMSNGTQIPSKMSTLRLTAIEKSEVYQSAHDLLPLLLVQPLHKIPGYRGLRTQIDQTAILTSHAKAMLASVLHPSRAQPTSAATAGSSIGPSVLPFLARVNDESSTGTSTMELALAFEALVRPRMPVVRTTYAGVPDQEIQIEAVEVENSLDGEADPKMPDFDRPEARFHDSSTEIIENTISEATQRSRLEVKQQKRDFTTLLEQSTDAQLAASDACSETKQQEADTTDRGEVAIKRPRIGSSHDQIAQTEETPEKQKGSRPVNDLGSSEPSAFEAARGHPPGWHEFPASIGVQDDMLENKGKTQEMEGYESEDSSDSSIPPIDATLVGMTDTEDEE